MCLCRLERDSAVSLSVSGLVHLGASSPVPTSCPLHLGDCFPQTGPTTSTVSMAWLPVHQKWSFCVKPALTACGQRCDLLCVLGPCLLVSKVPTQGRELRKFGLAALCSTATQHRMWSRGTKPALPTTCNYSFNISMSGLLWEEPGHNPKSLLPKQTQKPLFLRVTSSDEVSLGLWRLLSAHLSL